MATASIQVGNVTVTFEDEDRGAKGLSRLALKTLTDVVETCGPEPLDEERDVDDEEFCDVCFAGLLSTEHRQKCGED